MTVSETIAPHWESDGIQTPLGFRENYGGPRVLTVGSWIKNLRQDKDLSQVDLMTPLIGRSGAAADLSEIEQSRKGVNREFIEKLSMLLGLETYTRSQLLLAGRFLPSNQDVEKTGQVLQPHLETSRYPAYTLDFGGRVLMWNEKWIKLLNLTDSEDHLKDTQPNMLEIYLDQNMKAKERLGPNLEDAIKDEVNALFMNQAQYGLAGISWYELLSMRLRRHPEFIEIWKELENTTTWRMAIRTNAFNSSGSRSLTINPAGEPAQKYMLFTAPTIIDSRLSIHQLIPIAA